MTMGMDRIETVRISRLALASAALGLASFILYLSPAFRIWPRDLILAVPLLPLAAVFCGHLAWRGIRRSPDRLRGKAWAALGAVLGYLGLLPVALMGLIWWGMSQEGSPLDKSEPRASDEAAESLLIGELAPQRVLGATLIRYPVSDKPNISKYDFIQWRYEFPGFRKTSLEGEEARKLLAALRSGELALELKAGKKGPATSEKDKEIARRYEALRWRPRGGIAGGLLFRLKGGKNAFVELKLAPTTALFYSHGGNRFIRGISESAAALLSAPMEDARPAIELAFPKLSAEEALRKGEKKFGKGYAELAQYIRDTPQVVSAIGPVQEIRPARGPNQAFYWMDYSANFSFVARGEKGTAAVRVEIMDRDRNLEVVYGDRFMKIPDEERTIAVNQNPATPPAFAARGEALWRKGEHRRAIADLTRAIDSGAGGFDARQAYRLRADAHFKLREYGLAARDFTEALKRGHCESVRPGSCDGNCGVDYAWRARAYLRAGDYPAAVSDLDRVLETCSTESRHYRERAYALNRMGQYERAAADLTLAIEQDKFNLDSPEGFLDFRERAFAYEKLGDREKAAQDREKAQRYQRWSVAADL